MPETTQKLKEEVIQQVGIAEEYTLKLIKWTKDFLPHLVVAIITLTVGLWLIKRISKLAVKAMERRHVEVSLCTFFKSLIGIGLKVILFIMVAGMLGLQTTSF
ncbi:MAG: mechanosensitive ion channel family protein, partial [Bacteroidia bacterium]